MREVLMNIALSGIPDIVLINPCVFGDCGFFYESYNEKAFHRKNRIIC